MKHTLVILAAGIGRRFGGIKQMAPIGPSGEFIIDYSIYDAVRAGFDKVTFVISAAIEEDFRTTMGDRIAEHVEVEYVRQGLADVPQPFSPPEGREKPWGTGHAVLACRNTAADGPFAVINADDFYGRESYELLYRFLYDTKTDQSKFAMVAFILRNTLSDSGSVARGISYAGGDGKLTHLVERTEIIKTDEGPRFRVKGDEWGKLTGDELVSMNMWGFKHSIFPFLQHEFERFLAKYGDTEKVEFFCPSVVDKMIVDGEATVDVLKTHNEWTGITYPEDLDKVVKRVNGLIADGEYPSSLWA